MVNENHIKLYRMIVLKSALKLEIEGYKRSKSPTVYSIIKKEFNLKGNKESVLKQFEELINDIHPWTRRFQNVRI